MQYILKSGSLYPASGSDPLSKIKATLIGPVRKILNQEDELLLEADICSPEPGTSTSADIHDKVYTLKDRNGVCVAKAVPDYAEGQNPAETGWPLSHLPKVDRAEMLFSGSEYTITMLDSRTYSIIDREGRELLSFHHRGIKGGWILDDKGNFSPEMLCGIFVFCRYIELENEFMTV